MKASSFPARVLLTAALTLLTSPLAAQNEAAGYWEGAISLPNTALGIQVELEQDRAPGMDSLNAYFPAAVFTSNAIAGGDCRLYPGGNRCLDRASFASQFAAPDRGDYRLTASSSFRAAASDGTDLGANVARLYLILGLRLP